MLIECVGTDIGRRLVDVWDQSDLARRESLYRSLARIMLAVSRVKQPRIGAFRFNDDGTITLSNRPLMCATMILENEGTPRTMETGETYGCTDAFASDMITLHDNRLRSNPSAADDEADCRGLMAVRAMMRTMAHHFIRQESRYGPFSVQLTDLHAGNIIVDANWNITCIFDLGEVCALPQEMETVPYWLTGCAISELTDENLAVFDQARRKFMHILEEEEQEEDPPSEPSLSRLLNETWESQGTWFWHSLSSVDAAFYLVQDHLCPKFHLELTPIEQVFSQLWCENTDQAVRAKLADYHRYKEDLDQLFDYQI